MNDIEVPAPAWSRLPSWAWIIVAGVLAHGIVPLTDYVLWDGWWYAADLARPEGPTVMARLFHEVGRPLDMWFYAPLRWIGGDPVVWAKWLGTASWIASAVCVAKVLERLAGLPRAVATAVAVLVAALPIFDLLGELALWMNTACVLLFWLAWVLVSRLGDLAGWRAIAARLAALALFFVSFDLNSNLVMFYAVAVAIAGLRASELRPATLLATLPRAALWHADFLALPIVFWGWKTWLTPTSGFYATGYNQPSLAPDQLAAGYLGLLLNFVLRGLVEFLSSPTYLAAAAMAAILTALVLRRLPPSDAVVERPAGTGVRLLGWGVFLLLAAAFPYIVVGQPLASEGWFTRNCILCPLPVALIACGLALLVTSRWATAFPRAWVAVVTAIATLGVGGCVSNYLAYQAFGAKEWSLRGQVAEMIRDSDAAVVQLRDYSRIPRTIPYYPPIIWTFIANASDGPPKTLVIETVTLGPDISQPGPDGQPRRIIPQVPLRAETVDETITETTMPYALERVPRAGPQILVTAEPAYAGTSVTDLGLRYLFLSWLEPERLPEFVRGFIKAERHPLPAIQ
jgi:hypothetical protein